MERDEEKIGEDEVEATVKPSDSSKPITASQDLHFKISKRSVVIGALVIILLVLGFSVWKFKWYQPLLDRYTAAAVSFKVREGDKFSIEGAHIVIDGKDVTTDHNGNVTLENIPAGTYTLTVAKDGYLPVTQSTTLHSGDNSVIFLTVSKVPAKVFKVKGFVKNSISDQLVVNVQVTLGTKTLSTDPAGAYEFDNVVPADISLTFSKAGFNDKQVAGKVVDADMVTVSIPLVPSGQLVFVSNRDGYRALYSSLYDGTNQRPFASSTNKAEDFSPVITPDNKKIAFSSYRDGMKDSYGNNIALLYQVGADGLSPQKVSTDVLTAPTAVWSPNSQYLYYSGFTNSKLDTATFKVYDTVKKTVTDIGEPATGLVFSPDSTTVAYTVSSVENTPVASPTAYPSPLPSPGATESPAPTQSPVPVQFAQVTVNTVKTIGLITGERKSIVKKNQYISDVRFSSVNKSLSYQVILGSTLHRFITTFVDGKETEVSLIAYSKRRYVGLPQNQTQIFIENRDGKTDLYSVDVHGNNEKRLTALGVLDDQVLPQFDDSGAYISFAVKREGENALYIMALEGGNPKKVTDYYYDTSHS